MSSAGSHDTCRMWFASTRTFNDPNYVGKKIKAINIKYQSVFTMMKWGFDYYVHLLIMKDSEWNHRMGSPMDRTPPRSKDLIEIIRSKTICAITVQRPLKRQRKKRKKGGAGGSRTQGLWLKPPALCHWAMTPTDSQPSFFPFYYSARFDLDEDLQWSYHCKIQNLGNAADKQNMNTHYIIIHQHNC